MNTAIVTNKQLGTNCWSSYRFCYGMRCGKVMTCTYPEKQTCKAVEAEKAHIKERAEKVIKECEETLAMLGVSVDGTNEAIPNA